MPGNTQVDASAAPTPSTATPLTASRRHGGEFSVPKVPAKVAVALQKEKKVAKAVPKAQSGGMSLNDIRACRAALKKLQAHKKAALFMQPVDPVRDRAPKYVRASSLQNMNTEFPLATSTSSSPLWT